MWNKEYERAPNTPFRVESMPQSYNPWEASTYKILERPLVEPHKRSEVAIARAYTYRNGMGESAVEEAIELLGGPQRFCKAGDKVLIKPNAPTPSTQETYNDITHPSIVRALVRLLKDRGAEIWIGESGAWHMDMDDFGIWEALGYDKIAKEFGVKLCNWRREEQIPIKVPDPRYFDELPMPKSIVECDVFIDVPKFKNNSILGHRGLTISLKSMFGCVIDLETRLEHHRTPLDATYAATDVIKIIGADRFRLSLVDGIYGMDGRTHIGHRCAPGVIIASPDFVAAEAVCYYIAGYEFLENPTVQVPMKAGLGTGDPREIRILGERLEDVRYKFMPAHQRFVEPYMNVHEYMGGGICNGCLLASLMAPPRVEKDKLYAVVSGTRLNIPDNFAQYDEVWLVGTCACSPSHQKKGFMDKIKKAKTIKRLNACGGQDAMHAKGGFGGIYEPRWAPIGFDMITSNALPISARTSAIARFEDRREGRETEFRHKEGLEWPKKED